MKFLATTALCLTLLATPAAAESFSADQKKEIEGIIRDYITKNPEVMMEAMVAVKDHQVKLADAENAKLVQANHDTLFKNPNAPSIGPKDAKVTMVEFFDYNCGACKIMFNALDSYRKENPDLRVVFKEYPIFGENSEYPARIALAIHRKKPEKYFEYHSNMMKYQGRVTAPVVDSILVKIGVNKDDIKAEAESKEVKQIIADNAELARILRATGTPMVVMNDEIIPHALDLELLRSKVAEKSK